MPVVIIGLIVEAEVEAVMVVWTRPIGDLTKTLEPAVIRNPPFPSLKWIQLFHWKLWLPLEIPVRIILSQTGAEEVNGDVCPP